MAIKKLKPKTPEAAVTLLAASRMVKQYVSGDPNSPIIAMERSLPQRVDDAEAKHGLKIYDRMMTDPVIASLLNVIRMRSLENGLAFDPAVDPPFELTATVQELEDFTLAEQIAQEMTDAHDAFREPAEDVIGEMVTAIAYGHRLAEIGADWVTDANGRTRLVPGEILVKPRENYIFVVNTRNTPQGVIAAIPGVSVSLPVAYQEDFRNLPNFLPIEKFFHLRIGSKNSGPLGESQLRPAYDPWWIKIQTYPQLLKFVIQFAGPALIAYAPADVVMAGDATTVQLADGRIVDATPENIVLSLLEHFQASTIVALPDGSKVDLIESKGEGKAHIAAIELCNREMTMPILLSTRGTLEAQHGSRADSGTSQDLQDVVVRYHQANMQRTYRRQVCFPFTMANYGPEVARRFTPKPRLQAVSTQDFAAEGGTIAQLYAAGYLHWSQMFGTDRRLGLPKRDWKAFMQEMKEKQDAQNMQNAEALRMAASTAKDDGASGSS